MKGYRAIKYNRISLYIFVCIFILSILLNIPILRQILGIFVLLFLPGCLMVRILKLEKLDFWYKVFISIGLSISFTLFTGLFINYLFILVGVPKPLSAIPLALLFSIIILVLDRIIADNDLSFFLSNDNILKIQILFPIMLPIIGILGIQLRNAYGITSFNYLLYVLIIIYILILIMHKNEVIQSAWPMSIWMISFSILIMQGLATNFVSGGDFYSEYEGLKATEQELIWDISNNSNEMMLCLSTSLLPTIYSSILGTSGLFVPKAVYPLICSFIPVICFLMYKNYISSFMSFLSSLFFSSQLFFMYSMKEQMRFVISLLFFSLFLMVLFNSKVEGWQKTIILIVFSFSIISTYYALPVIFIYLLSFLYITNVISKYKLPDGISYRLFFLSFISIFLWWGMLSNRKFDSYILIIHKTISNLSNMFIRDMYDGTLVYAMDPIKTSVPETINIILHYIGFFFICIYIATAFLILMSYRDCSILPFGYSYYISMISMLILTIGFVFWPYISVVYGVLRIYQTVLVILSPAFVLGGLVATSLISNFSKNNIMNSFNKLELTEKNKMGIIFISILILLQFSLSSGLVHQAWGIPFSEYLNIGGTRNNVAWVYDSEITAAEWIYKNTNNEFNVVTDWGSPPASIFGFVTPSYPDRVHWKPRLFAERLNNYTGSYIFLRRANLEFNLLYPDGIFSNITKLEIYSSFFDRIDKIYVGNAAIFYVPFHASSCVFG